MKKLKKKKSVITGILMVVLLLVTVKLFVTPEVKAEAQIIEVEPGSGTLKAKVDSAPEGAILKLKSGSYTGGEGDKTVYLTKEITIEGVSGTVIDVPLVVQASGEDQKVTLKKFSSGPQPVEPNFIFIKVDSNNAYLDIDSVSISGISRGGEKYTPIYLDVTENADDSVINVSNSLFVKPKVFYGVSLKSSGTKITLDKTEIDARAAILLENGSDNIINIKNGSHISGPSSIFQDSEGIIIKKQKDLKINISNSTIQASNPDGDGPTKLFSFHGGADKSTGVTIDIKKSTLLDSDRLTENDGVLFGFSSDATKADNNTIKIDKDTNMYISLQNTNYQEQEQKPITTARKYSVVQNAAVIGIYDKEGNCEIKLYDDGDSLSQLKDNEYIKKEGYNFKGWFKDATYQEEFTKKGEDSPTAKVGENMDLYPKFAKIVKVQIGKDEYELEEGQTLRDIPSIDDKLRELVKATQSLEGYAMHGKTGGEILYTFDKDDLENLKNQSITEDVIVEAIHSVTVKINGTVFEDLEIGNTVSDISDQEKYKQAKLNNKSEKEFSRLVYQDEEERTFDESTPITENISLKTKHYAIVTFEGSEYRVEEGEKISTGKKYYGSGEDLGESLVDAMKEVQKKEVEDKTFDRFEDDEKNKIYIETKEESTISKSTTIKPIYQIEVKIGDNTYKIDEGENLNASKDKEIIKSDLQNLVSAVCDEGRNFTGFVISSIADEFSATESTADDVIGTIMERELSKNTMIYAKYNAKITIKCFDAICGGEDSQKTFEIDTGKTLQDLLTDEGYQKAKYQKYYNDGEKEDRFSRYTDDGGNKFKETDVIEKSMTLTPHYYAFVTISDDRSDVGGKYKVEEGGTLDQLIDFNGKSASKALATLRSNIVPSEGNEDLKAENLHFDKIVLQDDSDFTPPIKEDITIKGLYHYDVNIVEDYDNPHDYDPEKAESHEGLKGFKVYRGKTLKENETDVKKALEKLKNSATNEDKKRSFVSYIDVNTGEEYTEEELLGQIFNYHVYINARVSYKVEVGETSADVIEGHSIRENATLLQALEDLKNVSDKVFDKYTIDGVAVSNNDEVADTIITKYTKVEAEYNVAVTIGDGDPYIIKEGGKLSDLDSNTQQEIRKKLEDLQKKEGFHFNGYNVEDDVDNVMEHTFHTNTTISPKFNIQVTIDGEEFSLETGDTLKTLGEQLKPFKDKYISEANPKVFSRFVIAGTDTTFEEEKLFEQNTNLTTKYAYEIIIDDASYEDQKFKIEEGKTLASNQDFMNAVQALKTKKGKTFSRFVEEDDTPFQVDATGTISKNVKIKPIYSVTVTIEGRPFVIDEGKALESYTPQNELTTYLSELESVAKKEFKTYVFNGEEKNQEQLLKETFDSNTSVDAKYEVKITISSDDTVTLEEGSKLSDIPSEKLEALKNAKPEGKSSFAYFVDEEGKIIDDGYTFNTSMTITPKYKVKITINNQSGETVGEEEIVEGSKLSTAKNLLKTLKSNKEKDFKEFSDNSITEESVMDKNITLTALYTITVRVDGVQYSLDEGKALKDLETEGYEKPNRFVEFRDLDGNSLNENDELHKHTTVTAIYMISVSIPNSSISYDLESGQTLETLEKQYPEVFNAMKINNEGRKFSRFVNSKTNETIKENEPLKEDISIVPKFNIKIEVFYRDDQGKKVEDDTIEIELGEDLSLSEITEEENKKLKEWIDAVIKQLEKEGKTNYSLSKYIDEEGNDIDIMKTLFHTDSSIEAIFALTKEEPIVPSQPSDNGNDDNSNHINNDSNNNNSSSSYPLKEKAPNTGIEKNTKDILFWSILTVIMVILNACLGYQWYFARNKN